MGLSFHCRTGSTWRIVKRVRCSPCDTENQNLIRSTVVDEHPFEGGRLPA